MSTDNNSKNTPNRNSTLIIGGVIVIVAVLLFSYLMVYTTPEENMELVQIIVNAKDGCIAETLDGFAVNIGECDAHPGQYIEALVDQKLKERAALMNLTT